MEFKFGHLRDSNIFKFFSNKKVSRKSSSVPSAVKQNEVFHRKKISSSMFSNNQFFPRKFKASARPINLLFSSSFSSAELAALEISGGVPIRPDDVLNSESPELQPWGIAGTRRYLEFEN